MNTDRVISYAQLLLLAAVMLSGCGGKKEDVGGTEQRTTQHANSGQQPKAITQHPPSEKTPMQDAEAATANPLTGSVREYDEFHALFCKQDKGVNLSKQESTRLAYLETLDDQFTDADHMGKYKKAHDPDSCI